MKKIRNIKTFLEVIGISQATLASKLGVSQTSVSNWALGITHPRETSLEKMRKMAEKRGHQFALTRKKAVN
jgi:transcriptional regulator with XRE-family HTH domain